MVNYGAEDLHIPYKNWSDSSDEEQNYLEIERWAQRLKQCHAGPAGAPSGAFLSAYGVWDVPYATSVNTLAGYQMTQIAYGGGTELGDGNPTHDQYEFYFPAGTYHIVMDFDFTEGTGDMSSVTRNMYIEVLRHFDVGPMTRMRYFATSGTGTRDSTHLHLDVNFTVDIKWVLHTWVNFNGIAGGAAIARNKWGSPDYSAYGIVVEGGGTSGSFTPMVNTTVSHARFQGANIPCASDHDINYLTEMTQLENVGPAITPVAGGIRVNTSGLITIESSSDWQMQPGLFGGARMQIFGPDNLNMFDCAEVVPCQMRLGGGYYIYTPNLTITHRLRPWHVNNSTGWVANVDFQITHVHFTGIDDT